jgi:hypothetical protein
MYLKGNLGSALAGQKALRSSHSGILVPLREDESGFAGGTGCVSIGGSLGGTMGAMVEGTVTGTVVSGVSWTD